MTNLEKNENSLEKSVSISKFQKVHKALGPIAGGIILDLADLATFGPIGFYIGMIAGATISYYISTFYKLDKFTTILVMLIGGIYCTIPFTEAIPAATIVTALIRLFEKD
ncbi:MAG: hypothetical protein JXR48_09595 [Candidatus Delongbacteria bacterium]|nr:hypothetical protein [Candidatus Delongbacteria bacterium]MBN2835206.1 hypothetical protein [Candidatus Delongbacteria bacterium]